MTEEVQLAARSSAAEKPKTKLSGTSPQPRVNAELGVDARLPFAAPYKNLWEGFRDDEVTVRQLVAMRRTDGQARALYRLMTLPIRAALRTATLVPGVNVEGGEEEAEFAEQLLTLPASAGGMETSLNKIIAQLLMALFDGFSPFEMIYHVPDFGPLKGKWTLKKLAYRPSYTVTFLMDKDGNWEGFRQRVAAMDRTVDVMIPKDHSVYYAANEEERPFYGQSYFQSAFYHWDKKARLYYVAHLAAQRAAVGTRVGTHPPSPAKAEKDSFDAALKNLGLAQYMSIPEGYKVESLKEAGTFDFLAFINHHNSQMSKSILAPFFDDQQGSGGDTTLVDFGKQSDALFILMLETIMGEIEAVISEKVLPRFIDWNFDSGKYPQFKFGALTKEQRGVITDMFKTLSTVPQQNQASSPEFMHELEKQVAEEFGLEIDYETMEKEAEAAKAQQDELQSQMQQAQQQGGFGQEQAPEGALPPGFSLSGPPVGGEEPGLFDSAGALSLSEQLLREAEDIVDQEIVSLVRHVRTQEGARRYGKAIGDPITKADIEEAKAGGTKGKTQASPSGPKGAQKPQTPGQSAQAPVGPAGAPEVPGQGQPVHVVAKMGNAKWPGAHLELYKDGTGVVVTPTGQVSKRQKIDIQAFQNTGWAVQQGQAGQQDQGKVPAPKAPAKPAAGPEKTAAPAERPQEGAKPVGKPGAPPKAEKPQETPVGSGKVPDKVKAKRGESKSPSFQKALDADFEEITTKPADYDKGSGPKRGPSAFYAAMVASSAVKDPDAAEAVSSYQQHSYFDINQDLRDGRQLSGDLAQDAELLSQALEESRLPDPITVFRGMHDGGGKVLAALQPGAVFRDAAFLSTSSDEETSKLFLVADEGEAAADKSLLFEIQAPANARALALAKFTGEFAHEREILFPMNSTMRVVSIKSEGGHHRIVVTLVEGGKT